MTHAQERSIYCAQKLSEAGFVAYEVGGWVRDLMLKRPGKDVDLVTNATPDQVIAVFGADNCILTGKKFGVVKVKGSELIDIATLRGDGDYGEDHRRPDKVVLLNDLPIAEALVEDGARRDFAINTIVRNPLTGEIIDNHGGVEDLVKQVVRTVGNPMTRFAEDYLRMMRAIRFAAQLNFTIEAATWEAVKLCAPRIQEVAVERIVNELDGILHSKNPLLGLDLLMESGIMRYILPEVVAMASEGGMQSRQHHPEGNTWVHTRMVIEEMVRQIEEGFIEYSFALMLAALLHDIAKPLTIKVEKVPDGIRITNYGHDAIGAEMARSICHRFKLSNEITDTVVELVVEHMHMHDLHGAGGKTQRRYFERANIMKLIALQHADSMGTGLPLEERQLRTKRDVYMAKLEYFSNLPSAQRLNATGLVDGDMLRDEFGLQPGLVFRVIMAAALKAQEAGRFKTIRGARGWTRRNLERLQKRAALEQAKRDEEQRTRREAQKAIGKELRSRGGGCQAGEASSQRE